MTGKQYRAAREKLGLTQTELGDALGVAKNTIHRREAEVLPINREAELALRMLMQRARDKALAGGATPPDSPPGTSRQS